MGRRNNLCERHSCQSQSHNKDDASAKQGNSHPLTGAEQLFLGTVFLNGIPFK